MTLDEAGGLEIHSMIRNVLIAAMLAVPLLAFAPTSSAWACRPDPQQVCETVQDELAYQHACATGGEGLYTSADCAAHGALPGVLVCHLPAGLGPIVC